MIITDSGLHIWQAPTPERPWNLAKAHLTEPMSYEDLRVRMKEAGVDRAILVPPSFAGAYPEYSLEAAAKYPEQFAVMSPIPLNKPEGRKVLENLMGQPGMLGVRLTFHHEYDESWIRDGTADWFWPVAEKMNIPVMMNAPSIHKDVGGVAQRHPSLRLILDHMGRQKGMKDEKLGSGLSPTIELAKYPNVFVKLTSTQSCSTEDYPYRNIHPHLKRLIEAFGPRRCFWGTDLSAMLGRTKCTYRQAVTMFTEEMDFLSKEDLEFVMGRGLAECLRWPTSPSLAGRI
jgi:predicted TIM-barrel fold metal-dependent hydrolase